MSTAADFTPAEAEMFSDWSRIDTSARQARAALRNIVRDIPDIQHSVRNGGPSEDLLSQIEYRLANVIAGLDKALAIKEVEK